MPQNAKPAPGATSEADAAPPRAGLGGRCAVAAARAARRATRLLPGPKPVEASAADVVAAAPVAVEAPAPEAPLTRLRRWHPTRGRHATMATPPAPPEPEPCESLSEPPQKLEFQVDPEAVAAPAGDDRDADAGESNPTSSDLSVFEHLVRGDVVPSSEPSTVEIPLPPPEPTLDAPQPAAVSAPARATADVAIVAELGPGLRLRLRQLGFGTDAALAAAHPDQLRQGLGEISRMLNVEAWIEDARQREADARAASNAQTAPM